MLESLEKIEAIDLHCHYNHGVTGDRSADILHRADLDFLRKERRRCNIVSAAFSSFPSVLSTERIAEENDITFALAENEDWFYQWVVIDPREEALYAQAEKMLKSPKTLGIKIHPDYHKYSILEHGKALFSFAQERETFVLMHPQHIPETMEIANLFPKLKLIIAHLGSMEHIEAVKQAKHGNIYVDTSGCASYKNNIIEYAVDTVGSEKIFFGTDTYSCAFQKGRILLADISADDKENILYKNAKREFACFR